MADETNNVTTSSSSSAPNTTNTSSSNTTTATTSDAAAPPPVVVLGVRIKQERITPPASPLPPPTDDKSSIGPVKSSKQILGELFGTFSVAVPDELISDQPPQSATDGAASKHKKHKKDKKHKKSKHRERNEDGSLLEDGVGDADHVERRARKIKKEKRDKDEKTSSKPEKRARIGYPGDADDLLLQQQQQQQHPPHKRIKREKISPPRRSRSKDASSAAPSREKPTSVFSASSSLLAAAKPRIVIKSLKESAVFRDAPAAADDDARSRSSKSHHHHHHHGRRSGERPPKGEATRHTRIEDGELSLSDEETYLREKETYYEHDDRPRSERSSRRRKSGERDRSSRDRDRDRDRRERGSDRHDRHDDRSYGSGGGGSGSRHRSHSRRRDEHGSSSNAAGAPIERIDKKRLLEVARRNAIQMLESGKLPGAQLISAEAREKVLAKMRFGGKSVDELTEFCKKLSSGDAGSGYLSNVSDGGGDDDDDSGSDAERERAERDKERAFHHPFVLKDKAPIVMNIRNSVPIQPKTAEQTKAILMQYPVSSGQHHRLNESEWVPVAAGKKSSSSSTIVAPVKVPAPAPVPAPVPPVRAPPVKPTGQLEQQVQDYEQQLSKYAEQRKNLEQQNNQTPPPSAASSSAGGQRASASNNHANPFKNNAAPLLALPHGDNQQQQQQSTNIFANTSSSANLDVTSIISQRLNAMRKLQDNPHDQEAIKLMYNAQKNMSSWASSKFVPGQFTGSTGANILSSRELTSGFQAWAKRSDDHPHNDQPDYHSRNTTATPPPAQRMQPNMSQPPPRFAANHDNRQTARSTARPTATVRRRTPPSSQDRSQSPGMSPSVSDWAPSTSEDEDPDETKPQRSKKHTASKATPTTAPASDRRSSRPRNPFAKATTDGAPSSAANAMPSAAVDTPRPRPPPTEQAVADRLAMYRRAATEHIEQPPNRVPNALPSIVRAEPPPAMRPGKLLPKNAINFVRAGVAPPATKSRFGPQVCAPVNASDRIEGTTTVATPQRGHTQRQHPPVTRNAMPPNVAAAPKNPFHNKQIMGNAPIAVAVRPPMPSMVQNPFAVGNNGPPPSITNNFAGPPNVRGPPQQLPAVPSTIAPFVNRFAGARPSSQPNAQMPFNPSSNMPTLPLGPLSRAPDADQFDGDCDFNSLLRSNPFSNGPPSNGPPPLNNGPPNNGPPSNHNQNNGPMHPAPFQRPPMPHGPPVHRFNGPPRSNPFGGGPRQQNGPNQDNGGGGSDNSNGFCDDFNGDSSGGRPPFDRMMMGNSNLCVDDRDSWSPEFGDDADGPGGGFSNNGPPDNRMMRNGPGGPGPFGARPNMPPFGGPNGPNGPNRPPMNFPGPPRLNGPPMQFQGMRPNGPMGNFPGPRPMNFPPMQQNRMPMHGGGGFQRNEGPGMFTNGNFNDDGYCNDDDGGDGGCNDDNNGGPSGWHNNNDFNNDCGGNQFDNQFDNDNDFDNGPPPPNQGGGGFVPQLNRMQLIALQQLGIFNTNNQPSMQQPMMMDSPACNDGQMGGGGGGGGIGSAKPGKVWWTPDIAAMMRSKQEMSRGLAKARRRNDRGYLEGFKRLDMQLKAAIREEKQRLGVGGGNGGNGGGNGGLAPVSNDAPAEEEEEFDDDCI